MGRERGSPDLKILCDEGIVREVVNLSDSFLDGKEDNVSKENKKMYTKTKVTSKYQITLPKTLRKRLGIERGDGIIFEEKDDEILMKVEKKVDPVEVIEGILEGEDIYELKEAAASRTFNKKLGLE